MQQRRLHVPLVFCASLLASTSHASLVTNGDFETGDLSGWTKLGPFADRNGVVGVTDLLGGMTPHGGDWQAFVATGISAHGISQFLGTVAGTTYTVSFWLASPSECTGASECWYEFVWDDEAVLASRENTAFGYTQYVYELQASSSSTLLQFYLASPRRRVFLDDVSVVPVSATAAVPEPATMALTLFALLGAGVARRRRRAAA